MPTCPNGHEARESVAFCHECGAPVASLSLAASPPRADLSLYVAIASVLVIVLGTIAIVWVLSDHSTSRTAAAPEAGISVCGRAPTQRPTSIALSCDNSGATLSDVTWSEWNDQSATGTGTYAAGSTATPATVVLGAAVRTSAGTQFTLLTVRPSGGQSFVRSLALDGVESKSVTAGARIPEGGSLCAHTSRGPASQLGVIGKHTSCDFADQIRRAYLTAGGHGQSLVVTATSAVTRRTYRDISCSYGRYVVCVGGEDHSARVFFGPFN